MDFYFELSFNKSVGVNLSELYLVVEYKWYKLKVENSKI